MNRVVRLTEYRTALITAATTGKIDVRKVKLPAEARLEDAIIDHLTTQGGYVFVDYREGAAKERYDKTRALDPALVLSFIQATQAKMWKSLHAIHGEETGKVVVEHFRTHVKHKIGGRAKAMVVTDSRLHAVRYKQAFDTYITERGYTDVRTLVAFSGIVEDPDAPGNNWTEVAMNGGIKESELPEKFDSHEYQVLLATVHGVRLIVSWNFKHLVNVRREDGFNAVNLLHGWPAVRIVSPKEIIYAEPDQPD